MRWVPPSRLRRDGIVNRSTVEATADKSAGAERHALLLWELSNCRI